MGGATGRCSHLEGEASAGLPPASSHIIMRLFAVGIALSMSITSSSIGGSLCP